MYDGSLQGSSLLASCFHNSHRTGIKRKEELNSSLRQVDLCKNKESEARSPLQKHQEIRRGPISLTRVLFPVVFNIYGGKSLKY